MPCVCLGCLPHKVGLTRGIWETCLAPELQPEVNPRSSCLLSVRPQSLHVAVRVLEGMGAAL